jgi:hypothetical protein
VLTLEQFHQLLGNVVCQLEELRLERDGLKQLVQTLTAKPEASNGEAKTPASEPQENRL